VSADALRRTLRLPHGGLPMRANAAVREPLAVDRVTTLAYRRHRARQSSKKLFLLLDGPPYANGDPHMGHFLNKTLKDMFLRHAAFAGRRLIYVPGASPPDATIASRATTARRLGLSRSSH
jgi:isoleucyl-tRNA synthetase